MVITGVGTLHAHWKAGKLKVLAFGRDTRHPSFPDVPCTGEAGLKGYEAGTWFGVVTRAGTPRPIVDLLSREIVAALNSADLKERLVAVGFDRLKDCGAAARTLLAGDLIPSTLDVVDHAAACALGLAGGPALVIGFDGLGEQVEWQVAEFTALVGSLGGGDVATLPPSAWSRLTTLAPEAVASPAAVMSLSVLPTFVVDTMEQGALVARQRGLVSAWAAHAGVGAVTGALQAGADSAAVTAVLAEWRTIARAGGGHASLTWAPLGVKAQLPAWDDAGAAGRIMQRIKAQLDPGNVLNPGRFVAGI